ncbi:unnamed protein product [Adineta steineri]|uniref:Uncharacterized protein n=1 Tax=Adineta steineri TaxID=433720 RepID=A0A819NEL3_9BILA|nr:unnamed protein product [Adineta steineri]CAF1475904.1 unnamed protein product [Adineta steineri]CAF1492899.1 unnamed protein product [Adineta steineri]CAF3676865.1 unnamed protein product [Adineta steineri]CAF3994799.1 unnamed protein product [Adineta steineri]
MPSIINKLATHIQSKSKPVHIQPKPKSIQTKLKAYIITHDCNSIRFNTAKQNIERVFPKFFKISCFLGISLNDSRINVSSGLPYKKVTSNLLAFVDLWTYEIPKYSNNSEFEWSFVFEDDVNFGDPSRVSLKNFIIPLKEFMQRPQIQLEDGFFYLGICGPEYNNYSQIIISENTNNTLISQKGYGYCLHASGITAKRSKIFWDEMSSYGLNAYDQPLDSQLHEYSMRSKKHFYIFGTNFHYPSPNIRHYGIAYQDRGTFRSSISLDRN